MIWKELRENARWAALAFFGLLLAEIFTLSSGRKTISNWTEGITLGSNAFLFVSAFGCSAVGAILGALQILPELPRDRWAGLLHRPVPRQVIFLGKVVAGLILYGLATGLPLLCSIAYVVSPGRIPAPFVPGLALPAVSDLVLGAVFYFCALFLGLHSGRWWGSRAAIVLGAVGVLVLHLAGGWPLMLPLLASMVLYVAAWGAMLGSPSVRPWICRLALGLVILAGVETGLVLAGAALGATRANSRLVDYLFSNFYIAHDGTVLFSKSDGKGGSVLTDAEGKVVTDERYVGNNSGHYSLYPSPLADREHPRSRPFWWRARSSESWVELNTANFQGAELWYRIVGRRSYFVGYDKLSARCIGICDADGFKNAAATPRPFAQEPQGDQFQAPPYLFSVGSQLLTFDFTERQMSAPANLGHDTIYGALKFPYNSEHNRIAVAADSGIRVFASDGAPLFAIPYDYDARIWPKVAITATDDFARIFVQYYSGYYIRPESPEVLMHLDVFDNQGQRVATYGKPETNLQSIAPTWKDDVIEMLNMPVPSLLRTIRSRAHPVANELDELYPGILAPIAGLDLKSRDLAMLFGFATVLGALVFVLARRASLPVGRTVLWVALTLIFGLGGLLAYRLSTDWPARVSCPRCARKRSVAAVPCPRCHRPWEALPDSGAEIFEPA